ncbi:hypothetical protein B7P43_G11435 [Cryptotermes secundus]|uniref:Uncharacterized protein n=1 Tax=Cryptotermes secundus TaxID=105785 RepID=A0A2J7QYQ5_9NEOP|nr:hypothetical protein B7P43_G11435 [Cryptotermes secundus]
MNVAKAWATYQMVAAEQESDTDLVAPGPSTPTPRRPHVDPLGRLSGDMRKHSLVKIVKSEHSKGKHPSRQCLVCAVHRKRSMTAYICKFCVMPLHKGECFQKYHTLKHFQEHWVSDIRQTEVHTAEPLVPDPSPFEVESDIAKLKRYKSSGRGGPVPWPPRSPDLTPLDYFMWDHVKSLIYDMPVDNEFKLLARILVACDVIRDTPGIFERVHQSFFRRCNACIENGGRQFQHLL